MIAAIQPRPRSFPFGLHLGRIAGGCRHHHGLDLADAARHPIWPERQRGDLRYLNNLHQLARATDRYVGANGTYPLGIRAEYDPVAEQFRQSESWILMIMPYTEYKQVYDLGM